MSRAVGELQDAAGRLDGLVDALVAAGDDGDRVDRLTADLLAVSERITALLPRALADGPDSPHRPGADDQSTMSESRDDEVQ